MADGWRSPLNNPTDKLYLALRPVRKPLRAVPPDLALTLTTNPNPDPRPNPRPYPNPYLYP